MVKRLKEYVPLKQGLRLEEIPYYFHIHQVLKEYVPLKQGLRQVLCLHIHV